VLIISWIDTGENTLHLIGLDDQGAIVVIARGRIAPRLTNVPRCLIGIEAGMTTHYVVRELSGLGHDESRYRLGQTSVKDIVLDQYSAPSQW